MVRRKQSKKRPAHVVVQSLRLPQLLLHFLANKCAWWKKRTPVQSKQPPPTTKAVVHNMGSHCGQQWRSQRSRTQPIITLGGRNNPHQKCCARYMKHVVQAIGRKWLVLVWWCPSQGHLESFGIQTKLLHTTRSGSEQKRPPHAHAVAPHLMVGVGRLLCRVTMLHKRVQHRVSCHLHSEGVLFERVDS